MWLNGGFFLSKTYRQCLFICTIHLSLNDCSIPIAQSPEEPYQSVIKEYSKRKFYNLGQQKQLIVYKRYVIVVVLEVYTTWWGGRRTFKRNLYWSIAHPATLLATVNFLDICVDYNIRQDFRFFIIS